MAVAAAVAELLVVMQVFQNAGMTLRFRETIRGEGAVLVFRRSVVKLERVLNMSTCFLGTGTQPRICSRGKQPGLCCTLASVASDRQQLESCIGF